MGGIIAVLTDELRRVFTLRPVFSVLVLGVAIYTVFYPQPYINEVLHNVPIALVDQDGTTASRELARRLDATSDLAIALVLPDLPNAEREVLKRTVSGVVVIPKDFERDLLHGRPSPVAMYADASYFLIYQRVSQAVSAVARTMGAEIETARLIGLGIDPVIASAATAPMRLTAVPLFNPQGGYATYLLPAAFVLVVQQTLLIGVGLLGTLGGGRLLPPPPGEAPPGPVATVIGKGLAYLVLQAVILPLYLIVLPYLYGLPRLGSIWHLMVLALPFVLSVSALGMMLSSIFRTALGVQLASAAIGLPFFFLAGFAWPTESMPQAVRLLAVLVPSTSAIDGFVRLSQLGAPLFEVRHQLLTLWGLTVVYGGIAIALESRARSLVAPTADRPSLI